MIKNLSLFILIVVFAGKSAAANFDWSVPPLKGDQPVKKGQKKKEYFTPAERDKLFPPFKIKYDFKGVNKSRIKPVPKPNVHPRLLITPDDLPEIRSRIKSSRAAGLAYKKLCEETENFFNKGTMVAKEEQQIINEKPKLETEGLVEQNDDVEIELDEKPDQVFQAGDIEALANGSATSDLLESEQNDHQRISLTRPLALNALLALIDQDDKRGKRVAAALTHYAKLGLERLKKKQGVGAYRPVYYTTLAYDYAHPFMTEEQRSVVRKFLTEGLKNPWLLDGAMYGVGHKRPSHNWVSLVTHYILLWNLVIQGEEGYNAIATKTMTETCERWIQYFWGKSGCSFEGMGKNQLNSQTYIALARQGNWLICHPHIRRAIDSFYPAIMQPWGYEMTSHSGWGGSHNKLRLGDVLPMKFIAPKDPAVDFVYRNAVGDNYENIGALDVIWAMDWTGPKDWSKHAEQSGISKNFFSPGRSMLCARSEWKKDAMWLQFLCDQQYTAHMQMEIGNFLMSSHNRVWAAFIHANDSVGSSSHHNVLLMDGVEQGGLGRMVRQHSSDFANFATADLSPSYNGYVKSINQQPTYNDYHPLAPLKVPFASSKIGFDWRDPWQKIPLDKNWQADPRYEIEYGYRTLGMVKGATPYLLIMDNMKKKGDNQPHLFEWYMQVENDLILASMIKKDVKGFSFMDIILCSEKSVVGEGFMGHKEIRKGDPCLLVRLLRVNKTPKHHTPLPGVLETWNNVPMWPNTDLKPLGKRLKLYTWAQDPSFLVMIYPHRWGEVIPKTTWKNNGKLLQISTSRQIDIFNFDNKDGEIHKFKLTHSDLREGKEKALNYGEKNADIEDILDAKDGTLDELLQ